jgi:endo-1,4-beta-xylanase
MSEERTRRGGARWLALAVVAAISVIGLGAAAGGHQAMAATTLRQLADAKNVKIGTAVTASNLPSAKYGATAAREFNSLTPGNEMKWGTIEPTRGQFNWTGADQVVSFAVANNQAVRGHTLVWHSQLPSWVSSGGFTHDQLLQIMQQHIATEVGRYAGKLISWDVVNEPFNDDGTMRSTVFSQTIGPEYIADALRAARQADPTAKLYVNDFNIEGINAKSTAMFNLVSSLKQQGVPIDGVGIQSHLILGQVPSDLQQNIARFASLGLDVWISELDVRMQLPSDATKLAQQASDYAKVVNACLAVARCVGVTVWGFTDFDSWVPSTFPGQGAADLFDQNIDPKPAYNSVLTALGGIPPTPTPTPTPTATPTPPTGSGCTVTYRIRNDWGAGFTADLTITNNGPAINGWLLTYSYSGGQTIQSGGWGGTWSQSGANVSVHDAGYNAQVATNQTLTNVGTNGNENPSGHNPNPTVFKLNGTTCTTA